MNVTVEPRTEKEARREKAAALRAARKELRDARECATLAEEDLVAIRHAELQLFRIIVTP